MLYFPRFVGGCPCVRGIYFIADRSPFKKLTRNLLSLCHVNHFITHRKSQDVITMTTYAFGKNTNSVRGKLQRWGKLPKHGQTKIRLQTPSHLFQPAPVGSLCQLRTGARALLSVAIGLDSAGRGFQTATTACLHSFHLDAAKI